MDISRLQGQNFLTLESVDIELDSRGLLLIQGENKDDPSAESNGAGKSSIVDLLCWTIYGVTARGVSADAVINNVAKKNCFGKVSLEDAGNKFSIHRYRKDATNKNQVFVHQTDSAGHTVDLSKGTDRETQEVINQIMGCSLDVFMASVYCGQEKMPDLPGMTDKQLKLLIEEAAGVEVLSDAYTVARNKCTAATSRLDSVKALWKINSERIIDASDESESAIAESAKFDNERKDRAKAELAKAVPIKRDIDTITGTVGDADPLIAKLAELDEKLKMQKSEQVALDGLVKSVNAAQNEVTRLRTTALAAKSAVDSSEKSLASIDERVGTPCGECGKEYHADDLKTTHATQVVTLTNRKAELHSALSMLKSATEAHRVATEAAEAFKVSMTDFTAVAALQRDLTAQVNDIRTAERSIASKKKEIASIGELAKMKLSEANPWEKSVEYHAAEIVKLGKNLADNEEEIEKFSAEVELLESAVKVFGPAGVRAHILDTVTPYLNERTRDYLGALTDGNIHAEWNTLSKTAKGELREKFNIEVSNDMGSDSFMGLSGGEKRKVRLATAMALQDMVASRATKPINFLACDEIDDALDEAGLERLMTVLERKAREKGTVIIVSHNSLSDWCSNIITVTKSGGLSTVSGEILRPLI